MAVCALSFARNDVSAGLGDGMMGTRTGQNNSAGWTQRMHRLRSLLRKQLSRPHLDQPFKGCVALLRILRQSGRKLDFTNANDLPAFEKFVSAASSAGATGVGAGINYMGSNTLHVGFGKATLGRRGG